jgi:branched-chain amino acid transport system substrate-binding protein
MFKERRRVLSIVFLTIFVVSILLVIPSCQKKGEGIIRIGAILPLTGSLAWFGEHAKNACILLEDELNAQKKQVEIHIYDSKSTPKDGLSAYRKMIMENIRYCYVGLDPVGKAILPNIEKDGVIMFVGSVDNDIAKESKNIFRCYYGFKDQSMAQFNFLKFHNVKSVNMLLRDVSHIRKYSEDLLGGELMKAGIGVKIIEVFEPTTKDFRSILTKLLSQQPDAIIMSEYGMLYPTIFQQLIAITSKPPVILCGLGMLNARKEDYHLYEGVIFAAPGYLKETQSNFRDRYIKEFNLPPTYEAFYAYDSFKTIWLALKNSNKTIGSVSQYILGNKFPGVSQPEIQFDENGDLKVSTVFKIFQNDEVVDYE